MPASKKTAAKLPAKKKALPRVPKPQPQLDGAERFTILLEESEKFCEGVGLHKNLVREIIRTDSDWAFILKIDALLESAAKHVVRTGLRIKLLNRVMQNETLDGFVDSFPINGRTGILKLLDAACLPPEELAFVETEHRAATVRGCAMELLLVRGTVRFDLLFLVRPNLSFRPLSLPRPMEVDTGAQQ